MSSLALRTATPEDEAFVLALYASTREDLAVLGLPGEQRARLIEMQYGAQCQTYRALYPSAERWVVLVAGRPAGSVLLDRGAEEIRIVDIALLPEQRDAGVGGRVLQAIQSEARAASRSVALRVVQGSRALALYERLGFAVTAREPPYLALRWTPRDGVHDPPSERLFAPE
jgi:ribosomal protein S18 acetylase RimI-like enzyme